MSRDLTTRVASLARTIAERTRFSARRGQFLDMLDFDAFPRAYVFEVSMIDDHLADELNDLHCEMHHLEEMVADHLERIYYEQLATTG